MTRKETLAEGVTLYLGDCREIFTAIEKPDAVIMDPPYGVGFVGKRGKNRDGSIASKPGNYIGFEDTREYVKDTAVWVVETCLGAVKRIAVTPGTRSAFLYPSPDDMGCFYSAAGTGLGRWGFSCSQPILFYGTDPYQERGAGARANSCGQKFPNDANDVAHPCAKPLPQMMWLVNRASWVGELVCDPFMGSGTTGVAAVKLGRRFSGIELEPAFFDIACKRISHALKQPDLFIEKPKNIKQEAMI